jgi:hypothetical protein
MRFGTGRLITVVLIGGWASSMGRPSPLPPTTSIAKQPHRAGVCCRTPQPPCRQFPVAPRGRRTWPLCHPHALREPIGFSAARGCVPTGTVGRLVTGIGGWWWNMASMASMASMVAEYEPGRTAQGGEPLPGIQPPAEGDRAPSPEPGFHVTPERYEWFRQVLARTTAAGLTAFAGDGEATAPYLTTRQGQRRFTGIAHAAGHGALLVIHEHGGRVGAGSVLHRGRRDGGVRLP